MARVKNDPFVGVSHSDAHPNAATFQRGIKDTAGDCALILDKMTGLNSETNTINHTGSGRGAVIRHKLVNQHFGSPRRLTLVNPATSGAGGFGSFYVLVCPVFVPTGVDSIDVNVYGDISLSVNPTLITRLVDWTEVDTQPMEMVSGDIEIGRATRLATRVTVTGGKRHVLLVRIDINDATTNSIAGTINSWCVECTRGAAPLDPPTLLSDNITHLVRAPGTSGDTLGVNARSYDEQLFDTELAYHAYLTQGINVDLGGMYEYATGSPAGGNSSSNAPLYSQEDHDSGGSPDAVNPARSRFMAHTRASYAAEGEVEWPIVAGALGAIKTDGTFAVDTSGGAALPTVGMLDFYAPYPTVDTAQTVLEIPIIWPDFQTGASRLRGLIILGSNGHSTVSNWTLTAGSVTGASTTALTTATVTGTGDDFWTCSGTALSLFNSSCPDNTDTLYLRMARGAVKPATDEVCLLGYCFWFQPS